MKKLFTKFLILSTALVLSACGSNDSPKSGGEPLVKALSLKNEKMTCNTTVIFTERESGSVTKFVQESISQVARTVSTLSNGTEKLENHGEYDTTTYQVIDDSTKVFSYKMGYTFFSTHEIQKTKMENGLLKEVATIKGTRTGKDGYQFTDANGNKSPTKSYDDVGETITKIDGNTSYEVSSKYNGKVQEVYDYITVERVDGTTKSTRTTLRTPFTVKYDKVEVTTEKDDTNCRNDLEK